MQYTKEEISFLSQEIKTELNNNRVARTFKDLFKCDRSVDAIRKKIISIRGSSGIHDSCDRLGVDPSTVKHLWKKNKDESIFVKNPLFVQEIEQTYNDLKEGIIKEMDSYSPKYPKIKRNKSGDGHLLIIDIADLHINKYCESFVTGAEYNSKLAVDRAVAGTMGLLQKARGFDIDKILFVVGNDVLNTDNITNGTTKGTPQDTDSHWFKAFNLAKDCYVKCIEMCLSVADVDIIHCPSNHDLMSGCFLAETLASWFRKSKNVTFETSPKYRNYYKYHSNMILLEHGDKGKMANLPLVMAQEEPQIWASTKFRYGYLHHIHHQDKTQFKTAKDYIGANVTYLRSPSSADIWHAENQYLNIVAIEGFIHSKENGRVSHLTHYF